MTQSKAQTMGLVGVVLTVVCAILLYIVLSGPTVYTETTTTSNQSQASADTSYYPSTKIVNLNTCTPSDLEGIEGVGAKRAKLIVAYREKIGGYSSVEQIKDIYGIGDGLYAQIAPYLTV